MNKFAFTMFLFFLAIMIVIPSAGRSQYLIQTNDAGLQAIENIPLLWQDTYRGAAFALVSSLEPLNRAGFNYHILDEDVENGTFYWVEAQFFTTLEKNDLNTIAACKVVWNDEQRALVRARAELFLQELPPAYAVQRIYFRNNVSRFGNEPLAHTPDVTANTLSLIQEILAAVNIDQIYQSERHLSGEEPYTINGQLDSIKTRYSYSPEIYKAEEYIKFSLEEMGYSVELHPFTLNTFYDIQLAPGLPDYGWLVSEGKIFGTVDGGQSWNTQYSNNNAYTIWSIFPLDHQTVYAVGDYGLILKSSDGSNWQQQSAPTANFLFGVSFYNNSLGWICGDSGTILKTTNGGSIWSIKSTPTTTRLYDIFFINNTKGWAVGRDGRIIYTTDGGETWSAQTSGTNSRLYGVYFLDENKGFVVGWDGRLLKTTNGGANWTSVTVPLNEYFYDVDFVDANTGMVVGWGGACLSTTDGGNTWTAGANIYQLDVYGFDMVNNSEIWVSGESIVAKSEDSGNTWQMALNNISESSLNNLIATKVGTQYPDQYYIICAHYDDASQNSMVRAPGADDNASGTTTVIEAARVMANYNFNYSLRFVLFAGEEQGLVGSAAYAANAAANGDQILGVLNLDMTAYDGNNDGIMEIHAGTMSSSQAIGSFVSSNISTWGLSLIPQYITSGSTGASDHASFWYNGYPAILMIEDWADHTPYYHTTNDLLSSLNQAYFLENARLAIGSLALLAEIDSTTVGISSNETIPDKFVLHAPYPNPFNPTVNIEYDLPLLSRVTVEVYDILGQRVKQLVNGYQSAGRQHLRWKGKTEHNEAAPSGMYFVRVQMSNKVQMKKIVFIR
jgi:photosystem II stability/assembly factor-like uncharacterized protein